MKPKTKHCGDFEFTPDDEGIFDIDDGLLIACECPVCGFLVTLDYSSNLDYWQEDDNSRFWKYVDKAPKLNS